MAEKSLKQMLKDGEAELGAEPPDVPWYKSLGRGALQGATFGLADEASGVAESMFSDKTYEEARDESRANFEKARAANPKTYAGGEIGGGIASAFIPGLGALNAAKGAKLATVAGKAALQGGLTGFGTSDAEGAGELAFDTAVGAGVGAALPLAGAGGRALYRGVVKPSSAAKLLLSKGVDGLTVGQMDPTSLLGAMEQHGASTAFGHGINAQRGAAKGQWQKAVMGEAVAPGAKAPTAGSASKMFDTVAEGFDNAYDSVRQSPLSPRAQARPPNVTRLGKAMGLAAEGAGTLATDADIGSVRRLLDSQMTMLQREGATPKTLMRAREVLRKNMAALPAGDPRYEMLSKAEGSISNRIDYALPKEAAQTLRATDAQYGKSKVLERTVRAAGDSPDGFTPSQLSSSVRSATKPRAYARGGGGPLRELAEAGQNTLDATVPRTGVQGVFLDLPGVKQASGGLMSIANLAGPKRLLMGQTAPQKFLSQADDAVSNSAIVNALLGRTNRSGAGLANRAALPGLAGRPTEAMQLAEDEERRRRELLESLGVL
jgi:hypothetical protein